MKKLLIVLIILMTASLGLFAQLTPYGSVRLDFGGSTTLTDGNTAGEWNLNALTDGTYIGLKGAAGDVNGQFQLALDGGIDVAGVWNAGPAEVKAGHTWLPATNWSSLAIWGNSNWAIGATATGRASFIQIGALGGYFGVAGQSSVNGAGGLGSAPTAFLTDQTIPIIFAGYDYNADAVSFGISATFWKTTTTAIPTVTPGGDDVLPMLFTVHGKYDAGAFALGLNAGFHIAPGALPINAVLFGPAATYDNSGQIIAGDFGAEKDDTMLEAMLDFSTKLDPATIAVTVGYVHNFAPGDKGGGGNALQAGFSASIEMGSGFTLIPGVVYTNYLSDSGNFNQAGPSTSTVDTKMSKFDYGVSLAYSF
jgi:hypothetical protein